MTSRSILEAAGLAAVLASLPMAASATGFDRTPAGGAFMSSYSHDTDRPGMRGAPANPSAVEAASPSRDGPDQTGSLVKSRSVPKRNR